MTHFTRTSTLSPTARHVPTRIDRLYSASRTEARQTAKGAQHDSGNEQHPSTLESDGVLRASNASVAFDVDGIATHERPTAAREPSIVDLMRQELNLDETWPTRVAIPNPVERENLALEFLRPHAHTAITALSASENGLNLPTLDSAVVHARDDAFEFPSRVDLADADGTMLLRSLLSPRAREAFTAISRRIRRSQNAKQLLDILNGVATIASDAHDNNVIRDFSMTGLPTCQEEANTAPPTPEQWHSNSDSEQSHLASEDADGNRQFEEAWAARFIRREMDEYRASSSSPGIDDILMDMEACSQWPPAIVGDTVPAWVGELLGDVFAAPATRFNDSGEEFSRAIHQYSYDVPVPSLLGVLEGEYSFEEYWRRGPQFVTTLPLLFAYGPGQNEGGDWEDESVQQGYYSDSEGEPLFNHW
ncbi:hypothetical protein DFH08DRAFT_1088958 [Mycena albidolilacea]|uniref:Uncharacterized protein n=1 Tax=Mycena albidolilacea TaxID=1033008 RepID=A0AAD6Z3M9_9AGAR|nr:hypothetical protein DFH08DRAFT_1088958 [Mycena albidolilacea]